MKKLFLAILFSAVLFIGLPFYNVNAMEVTYDVPFTAIPDLTDLLLGMLSGAKYDLSEVSTLEEAAEQHKNSLKSGYHFLQGLSQSLWNWQVTQAGLGNSSLTQDTDMAIYVSPADLAAYMGYNLKWWERDKEDLDIPAANPDVNFIDEIDYINKRDSSDKNTFWFYNYPVNGYEGFNTSNNNFKANALIIDFTDYSWVFETSIVDSINSASRNSPNAFPIPLTDINIVSNNGTYSFSNTFQLGRCWIYNNGAIYDWQRAILFGIPGSNRSGMTGFQAFYSSSITISQSGTLQQCFDKIKQYFKNVNIYVDGVLYSYVGDVPEDYISAPDVYGIGNTGIDIFDVFYPGLTSDYGGLSINGFLEWLKGKLGSKDVGLDDLIEDAPDIVIGLDENDEPTIRPITYDDTRPVPIVIDEDIPYDPDPPTPTPTPDPSTFPLPPFPTFPIPSDIPNANIQHTVLAEIVDATQTVVPQDLMTLIWATFSLLIIGGIIYILHK